MRPHRFKELVSLERKPSVFAGAGLSCDVVPLPADLLARQRASAEAALAVATDPNIKCLYEWADAVLEKLNGLPGEPAKLRLAKVLGILDNQEWAARISYPSAGLSPRHRILARLAREEILQGIWTWNWDCLLESALESIGVKRGLPERTQPWLTRFASIVIADDFQYIGQQNVLCVLKPHGCASRLVEADRAYEAGQTEEAANIASRFMIGAKELNSERDSPTDRRFFNKMKTDLSTHTAIIVGWSVSEPYLQAVINDALEVLKKGRVEELSIVDPNFNDHGHAKVTECYGLTREQVFFKVETDGDGFTADAFFLWLQSLLTAARLEAAAMSDEIKLRVREVSADLEDSEIVISCTDVFVPAWTRLCWRGTVVTCPGFDAYQLDLDGAEEHIPLVLPNVDRKDLAAAAILFSKLGSLVGWNMAEFPGALWNGDELRLVLPLPVWGELDDLAALKALNSERLSLVQRIDILPLHFDPDGPPCSDETLDQLKLKVSREISLPAFCTANAIGVATDISEVLAA